MMKVHWNQKELNPLLLKAAILCYGLRPNNYSLELCDRYNPTNVLRTGNIGVHIKFNGLVVNASMQVSYVKDQPNNNFSSPFELKKVASMHEEVWVLCAGKHELISVELLEPPSWYTQKTSSNMQMCNVFLSEGENNLMGALPYDCKYIASGKACQYCVFDGSKLNAVPKDYAETIFEAYKNNSCCTATITGGNTFSRDRGLKRYFPYLQEISAMISPIAGGIGCFPLQVECSPPQDTNYLQDAVDQGVNSFSINFELFGITYRERILPAKSKIPDSDYINAWRYVTSIFGAGSVSSAIIFGIEPKENTIEGARWLISEGVRPNVIPLKHMLESDLGNFEIPDFADYYDTCLQISEEMQKQEFPKRFQLGCSTCGGCNLEGDDFQVLGEML